MKIRSSVIAVLLAVALAVIFCATAMAADIPSPTDDFYIYDGADVIDKDVESYIIDKNKRLNHKTDAEIVIVTVKTTGDMAIKDYADEIFTKWSIGDKEKKNGLLLLLATEDDNYWITQGSGIEDRMTTGSMKTILDSYLEPHFAAGDYSEGVKSVFDKFLASYNSIYSINVFEEDDTSLSKTDGKSISGIILTVVAVIAGIVVFIVIVIFVVKNLNLADRYISKNRYNRSYPPRADRRVNSIRNQVPRSSARPSQNGKRPAQRPSTNPRPASSSRPRQNGNTRPGANPRPRQTGNARSGANPRPNAPQSRNGRR